MPPRSALQGGIHPDFDGEYYLDVCRAVKEAVPDIHVHGFTALEVTEGAKRLDEPLESYLRRAMDAGLRSLPGTAAEILDDDIRAILCPDKIDTEEWLDAHRTAHRVGLRSNVTIMFGAVEQPVHWARHIVRTRDLQKETGRVHRVRRPAVRAHGCADLPAQDGPTRPDVPRDRADARGRAHRLPRPHRQHPGLVGQDRVRWARPAAPGRRERRRRHADEREHLRVPPARATAKRSDPTTSHGCSLRSAGTLRQRSTLYGRPRTDRAAGGLPTRPHRGRGRACGVTDPTDPSDPAVIRRYRTGDDAIDHVPGGGRRGGRAARGGDPRLRDDGVCVPHGPRGPRPRRAEAGQCDHEGDPLRVRSLRALPGATQVLDLRIGPHPARRPDLPVRRRARRRPRGT